jgi:hypothetical protein
MIGKRRAEAEDEAKPDRLRGAFEKWAIEVGFRDFTVKDDEADDLDLEYCDDDVELVWCAFAEGAANG